MKYSLVFYLTTLTLTLTGIWCFAKSGNSLRRGRSKYKKISPKNLKQIVKFKGDAEEYNNLFSMADLNITIYQYQAVRYIVFAIIAVVIFAVNRFNIKATLNISFALLLICYFATTPRQKIMGKRTPFKFILDMLAAEFRNKKNNEINRAMSQLKNLTVMRQDNPPGTLFILEQLRKYTKTIRPIFNRMIALYHEDKKEEAEQYFASAIGTKEAARFANLLFKLDSLTPAELKTQLVLYQENIKRELETERLKTNERKSYLIYFIVLMSVFVILVNFVVVVYVIDTMGMLKFLF